MGASAANISGESEARKAMVKMHREEIIPAMGLCSKGPQLACKHAIKAMKELMQAATRYCVKMKLSGLCTVNAWAAWKVGMLGVVFSNGPLKEMAH